MLREFSPGSNMLMLLCFYNSKSVLGDATTPGIINKMQLCGDGDGDGDLW